MYYLCTTRDRERQVDTCKIYLHSSVKYTTFAFVIKQKTMDTIKIISAHTYAEDVDRADIVGAYIDDEFSEGNQDPLLLSGGGRASVV